MGGSWLRYRRAAQRVCATVFRHLEARDARIYRILLVRGLLNLFPDALARAGLPCCLGIAIKDLPDETLVSIFGCLSLMER